MPKSRSALPSEPLTSGKHVYSTSNAYSRTEHKVIDNLEKDGRPYTGMCYPCTTSGKYNCNKKDLPEDARCYNCERQACTSSKKPKCVNTRITVEELFAKQGRLPPPRPGATSMATVTPARVSTAVQSFAAPNAPHQRIPQYQKGMHGEFRNPYPLHGRTNLQYGYRGMTRRTVESILQVVMNTIAPMGPFAFDQQYQPQPSSLPFNGIQSLPGPSSNPLTPILPTHPAPMGQRQATRPPLSTNENTVKERERRLRKRQEKEGAAAGLSSFPDTQGQCVHGDDTDEESDEDIDESMFDP